MTAPFARSLCGYRSSGLPSTSDANDTGSIELGHALFEELGVASDAKELRDVGHALERETVADLAGLRPDLMFSTSKRARDYLQYRHLSVISEFRRSYTRAMRAEDDFENLLAATQDPQITTALKRARDANEVALRNHELVQTMLDSIPEESMLKSDIAVSNSAEPPELFCAISSKWSLRTDRAQDCISQGSKLVSQRRGRMPHFAVLTMEPRPAMLKLLAAGSGSIDCIYHLALPELTRAVDRVASTKRGRWSPGETFERMVRQGRLLDYEELRTQVARFPKD